MNAPITVSVPYRHNALQTLEMLIAAGIPATPQIKKGKVRIVSTKGDLVVTNKKTWVRGQPFIFQWNPPAEQNTGAVGFVIPASRGAPTGTTADLDVELPAGTPLFAYEPRPMFKANDAERFVILATFVAKLAAAEDPIRFADPLMQKISDIYRDSGTEIPANVEEWRALIDRAVTEVGGAK